MLQAELYEYIYIIVVTLLAIFVSTQPTIKYNSKVYSIFVCSCLVFILGNRPISIVFGDTIAYAEIWETIVSSEWEGVDLDTENLIFDNLLLYSASLGIDISIFFTFIAALYYGGILHACIKLFPSNSLYAFVVCLSAFSTFSYGVNGIKAGAATSIFLVALAYRSTPILSVLFALLAWGFHHSMQLVVVAYMLTIFLKDNKWYLAGWLFCLLMAISHVSFFQYLFAGFTDTQGQSYLNGEMQSMYDYNPGLRLDFILYSAVPILMGYYVKYKYKLMDVVYDTMLNLYLACNGVWLLCMYAMFTNRIAYLSWFMYPILLIYPCLTIKNKKHPLVINRNLITTCHLLFTWIMFILYRIR